MFCMIGANPSWSHGPLDEFQAGVLRTVGILHNPELWPSCVIILEMLNQGVLGIVTRMWCRQPLITSGERRPSPASQLCCGMTTRPQPCNPATIIGPYTAKVPAGLSIAIQSMTSLAQHSPGSGGQWAAAVLRDYS